MKGPNYFDRPDPKPAGPDYLARKDGVDWRDHERSTARRSGDRQVSGSGNQPGRPGDVTGFRWHRENKATKAGAEGMFIKGGWLRKLCADALAQGKEPLLELRFAGQEPPVPTDWVLVPAEEFEDLRKRAGDRTE